MRIDAYNAVSQVYQSNGRMNTKSNTSVSSNDKLEISQSAKSYQTAKTSVAEASDIRMDKIDMIKSQMAAGNYFVSAESFADKILNKSQTLTF